MVTIRLKDKKNGCLSREVSIEDIILNQYEVEFEFPNYIDEYVGVMEIATLPYKDFLFFQNDYEVIIDEHTPIVVEVNEEHIKQQLDYFKNKDLVYVSGGRGYGKTQYEKLQHNWDELKKIIEQDIRQGEELIEMCPKELRNTMIGTRSYEEIIGCNKHILSKMQELEGNNE